MTKRITWVDNQGRYRVTTPAYNDFARPPGLSDDELLTVAWLSYKTKFGLPPDHPSNTVEASDLTAKGVAFEGHYFRYGADTRGTSGAWEMDVDGLPKVNMVKAQTIHMDHIRKVRDAELVKLDTTSLRAIEGNDVAEKQRVATEKQALRDIPQTFDLTVAATPSELKVLWPSVLPRE